MLYGSGLWAKIQRSGKRMGRKGMRVKIFLNTFHQHQRTNVLNQSVSNVSAEIICAD